MVVVQGIGVRPEPPACQSSRLSTASFTIARRVGRVELAMFINPAGLSSIGRNLFAATAASGDPIVGNPGDGAIGTISQTFLEMSNVNVIEEMIRMIVGQRAYEINSRAIQTADAMLQAVSGLKR